MQDMQIKDERLRQSAVVFENTREGVIVTDPELTIVDFNKAFSRLTEIDQDEISSKRRTLKSIQPLDEDFYSAMQEGLLKNGSWQGEVLISRKSGSVQNQLLSINVVKDNAGKIISYVGFFTDITKRKLVEQEREHLINELQDKNIRLERFVYKRFVYTISHELKTPLVTISGYSGMLRRDCLQGKTEQAEAHYQRIEVAIADMSRLLDDLLKLAHLGYVEKKLEPVSLSELAAKTSDQLRYQIARGNIKIDIAPDMPVVMADRVRLLEVLQNLMENAIKFSAGNPEPRITIDAVHDKNEIICSVHDNGKGIDPEYHERVFNMFERLDQNIEGTGVGLALVRGIVESHGGKVWVESDGIGEGSSFRFSLPRAE